ncbi:LamB/YcsF family protein [Brevibacterium yomogidense]|uniref:LamB/YcsF family protein n=1 Tax=Brevibacterium yomogidense TaxID=946573 RepID=UPI0018DF3AA9|nr:5-oxoprolinase subunit PxpA [Brevibacterium yomogidense]
MDVIDLNSDAAESFGSWTMGDDEGILGSVSSINIACGFHGGDARTMTQVSALAAQHGVTVGAHVGYRDLPGFGRRFIAYAYEDLYAETLYQLGALAAIARTAGTAMRYVKPHGALAHAVMHDTAQAQAVVDAVAAFDPDLALLLLPRSQAAVRAEEVGLRVVLEAFADRAYRSDGSLVPRTHAGAVLHDQGRVVENMLRFAEEGVLIAEDGTPVDLEAGSICVHSDTPGSVRMAHAIRAALEEAGVTIRGFA